MPKTARRTMLACASTIALGVTMSPSLALAQTSSTADEAKGGAVEEVVVTARKREERAQDVPVAVTSFNAEELARYNTNSVALLAARTPQLQVGTLGNPNGNAVSLRGVGAPTATFLADQAVSINIDGVQLGQSHALTFGLFDVRRIEVLKGPQTLFFGKNSPGGVISVVSADPGREFEGRARAGYEFANDQTYGELMVSIPVSDTIGLRLDGYLSDQKGWFRNTAKPIASVPIPAALGGGQTGPGVGSENKTYPNTRSTFLRGTLLYRSEDGSLDVNLKVHHSRRNQKGGGDSAYQAISCVAGVPQFAATLNLPGPDNCKLDRFYNSPDTPPRIVALSPKFRGPQTFDRDRQTLISVTTNYRPTDEVSLTAVTGYYKFGQVVSGNFGKNDLAFLVSLSDADQEQFTQEVRLQTSFSGPLNVMVGGFYQFANNGAATITAIDAPTALPLTGALRLTGPIISVDTDVNQQLRSYSGFAQVLYNVTPQLELAAGVRYSHDRKKVQALAFPNSFTSDVYYAQLIPNVRTFDNISPDITLTYKWQPNITLYSAYREGFISGGFNVATSIGFGRRVFTGIDYNEETVSGLEVGSKGTLFDRQLRFDLAVYHFKYKDLQVSAFDPVTVSNRLTNAGTATVKGVELSLDARPHAAPGLSLYTAISYNPARFGTFNNSPCYVGQTQANGCAFIGTRDASGNLVILPATPTQVANIQDLSGRPLHRNSDWSWNAGLTYERPIGGGLTLTGAVDVSYVGPYFAQLTNDPGSRQRAATRLNASVGVRGPDGRWELSLIGANLTQELRAITTTDLFATGGRTGTPTGFDGDEYAQGITPPRTVTVQLTARF